MTSRKVRARVAVIKLNRIAVFRTCFKLYYRCARLLFSFLSRYLFPEIISLKVHRGCSTGDWEPGVSDIDVLIEIRGLTPAETARFIGRWAGFYASFKFFFPIIGETIIASRPERELYNSWGDIRSISAQTPAHPGSRVIELKTALDMWTEGLHAHTRLAKMSISRTPTPAAIARRELRKSVLDIIRYSAAYRLYPPLRPILSRPETENSLDASADFTQRELAGILRRSKDDDADDAEMKRLIQFACAHTTNILEQDALHLFDRLTGFLSPAPVVQRFPPSREEDESASRVLVLLKKGLGIFFDSAVFDDVFNSVVVLKQVPGRVNDLACGISILDCMTACHSSMQGAIFPLGPRSLALMGIGAYGDDPLKLAFPAGLDAGAGSAVCLRSGTKPPFAAHHVTFFQAAGTVRPAPHFVPESNDTGRGLNPSAKSSGSQSAGLAPGGPLLAAMYLESLSHFLRTWRGCLEPGAAGAIYAVSRAVSFWLYFVKKIPQPCFPLQPLLETFKRERGLKEESQVFETGLMQGLQPADLELVAALNAETLAAAPAAAAEIPEKETCPALLT